MNKFISALTISFFALIGVVVVGFATLGGTNGDGVQVKAAETVSFDSTVIDELYAKFNEADQAEEIEIANQTLQFIYDNTDEINGSRYGQDFEELKNLAIRLSSNWNEEISRLFGYKLEDIYSELNNV
ncbi:hypothetical protein [Bacillus andreraoultii]|uniref:hypothetical protein n=1 Tax=Bacillus andreraoultii TaxID=1499685 RepID=UPI00053A4BDB|nr:hypothetical protein [Bacillus andreraoultii]